MELIADRADQKVGELEEVKLFRRERLHGRDVGKVVRVVEKLPQSLESLSYPIRPQVREHAVGVEVQDPVTQELIVELVEHELVVAVMKPDRVELIRRQHEAAKAHRLVSKEQFHNVGVESQSGGTHSSPLELTVQVVNLAELSDFVLQPSTLAGNNPEAANKHIPLPREEGVWRSIPGGSRHNRCRSPSYWLLGAAAFSLPAHPRQTDHPAPAAPAHPRAPTA